MKKTTHYVNLDQSCAFCANNGLVEVMMVLVDLEERNLVDM